MLGFFLELAGDRKIEFINNREPAFQQKGLAAANFKLGLIIAYKWINHSKKENYNFALMYRVM
jgi:hypothetical protein